MAVNLKKTGTWNITLCSLIVKYFVEEFNLRQPQLILDTTLLSHTCSNFSCIYTSICDFLLFYSTFTQHNEMSLAKTSNPIFGVKARGKTLPRIVSINHSTQCHVPEFRHIHASTPNATKDVWSETVCKIWFTIFSQTRRPSGLIAKEPYNKPRTVG